MKTNRLLYEELELVYTEKKEGKSHSVKLIYWLKKAWHFVIDVLTKESEIKIEEKCDRQGNTYWYAYDPATGYSTYLATEQEVLAWIEERYNRQNTVNTSYLGTQSSELWLRQKM